MTMRTLIILAFCVAATLAKADSRDGLYEGGRSPDGQLEVWGIHDGNGGHFVVRDSSGKTIFSEESLRDEFGGVALSACKVLWRSDSHLVAIAFNTTKFSVELAVFYHDGETFQRVAVPEYDPDSVHTHRVPHRWLKNGDLVLDITEGYHTKFDGGISGYFATVHFTGEPPKATKGPETKPTDRD